MKKKMGLALALCLLSFGALEAQAEAIPVQRKATLASDGGRNQKISKGKSSFEQKEAKGPTIEVGLLSGNQISLMGLSDFQVKSNGKVVATYKSGSLLSISKNGKSIAVNGKKLGDTLYISTNKEGAAFAAKGNRYRGSMKLISSASGNNVTLVNVLPLEDYLKGVIPKEVIPSWKMDAIKAQAVAARTYALYHKGGFKSQGYDVTDDTRSQVYGGISAETESTNRAVNETAGEIVTYQGKVIDAVFHSSSGGYTENSEMVWGSNLPYLRGVKEVQNGTPWTKSIDMQSFAKAVYGGKLKSIQLSKLKIGQAHHTLDRGISGRVRTITLNGTNGKKLISGDKLQSMYGLNSTLFDISVKGKMIVITGYGYGHGLGLSQWGAEAMASRYGDGKDYYKKILQHYFTGTIVEKLY